MESKRPKILNYYYWVSINEIMFLFYSFLPFVFLVLFFFLFFLSLVDSIRCHCPIFDRIHGVNGTINVTLIFSVSLFHAYTVPVLCDVCICHPIQWKMLANEFVLARFFNMKIIFSLLPEDLCLLQQGGT